MLKPQNLLKLPMCYPIQRIKFKVFILGYSFLKIRLLPLAREKGDAKILEVDYK